MKPGPDDNTQNSDYLEIYWDDTKQLRSARFRDIFFSSNGIEEAMHVFMAGNNLPGNFNTDFHIAELGFGTGLNLFLALELWRKWDANKVLRFTSFEIHPLPGSVMTEALKEFNAIHGIMNEFLIHWQKGKSKIKLSNLEFELIVGDVRNTIHTFNHKVDCWFLDGFSPKNNPEMWEKDLFKNLAERTNTGGTLSTFSSAAMVRENLMEAGFEITRVPGFGKKKHMLTGKLV